MTGVCWILGVLTLFCISCHFSYGKEILDDTCGNTTFTDATGQISVDTLPAGQNCTFKIIAGNYTPQVALKFNKILLDPLVFNLTIYGGSDNGSMIANLTQGYGDLPYVLVVSRYKVTYIVFSRTNVQDSVASSGFTMSYDTTKCQVSESSLGGVINSPIYLPGNGSIICVYNETNIVPGYITVLSFLGFNVQNGTMTVTMGDQKTSLSGLKRPGDLFGAVGVTNLVINITFNQVASPQNFTALYQSVDPSCSGKFQAERTYKPLSIPSSNQLPVKCYIQIAANQSHVYIDGNQPSSVNNAVDSFVFYDGDSAQGQILGTLGQGKNWFVSSGQAITMVANLGSQNNRSNTLKYRSDDFSMYYSVGNETVSAEFDGAFVQGVKVVLQFDSKNPTSKMKIEVIQDGSTITDAVITVLCDEGDFVYNFTKDTVLFPVVTSSSLAMVLVTNLNAGQKVKIQATALTNSDCNQILNSKSGQITLDSTSALSCNIVVNTGDDMILTLDTVTLCPTGKLEVYEGAMKTSTKIATLTSANTNTVIPQMKFNKGSNPRLVWTDSGNTTCTDLSLVGRYWTQNNATTCGSLPVGLSGTVSTPNYPNQYPLNVQCNWSLPSTTNTSMMFLSVKSINFNMQQNITLQNSTTNNVIAVYNGTTLPNDMIITNKNLSMVFSASQATDGEQVTQAAQGAQISYKVLTCGGLVTTPSANITVPQTRNQSRECIWIIQVPANGTNNSVNIVSANFTVFGYKNAANGSLEVHDGGSIRDEPMSVNMTSKNSTNLKSRRNLMLVRYVYTNSTSGPFGVNITYVTFNCNSTMQCDNGICIHPEWICDGIPQCMDGKDEKHCNGSRPIPPQPTPAPPKPHTDGKKGVAGYWVFISLLFGVILGIMITVLVPACIKKIRQRNISRMSNYGSLHEET
ncbi:Domain first found in C1r [Mactra antiquata]